MITIAMPVYEGVDLLDVAGPFEMLSWVNPDDGPPIAQTLVVSADGKPVAPGSGLVITPHGAFADAPSPDVLWVPGGTIAALQALLPDPDNPYFDYLVQAAANATWVCSVCEGALLLARAGLLYGYQATTHWAFVNCLKSFEGIDVDETNARFVLSGNRLTGGGISSGLDESLMLIQLLWGTKVAASVQVTTQYFPDPPVAGKLPPAGPCPVSW